MAVHHLGLWKFKFFDGLGVKRPILHNLAKLRKDLSIGCCDIAIFVVFKRASAGGQSASLCQISSKSVKRLRRYGDLTVFKMEAVRHLGFWKFKFF